jgi:hypothetical protein
MSACPKAAGQQGRLRVDSVEKLNNVANNLKTRLEDDHESLV